MNDAPYTTVFDAQRALIENTADAIDEGLRTQRAVLETTAETVESSGRMATQTNDLSRRSWHTFLDGIEDSVPAEAADFGTFRQIVDETHDATAEGYDRTTEAAVEAVAESEDAYEAYLDAYEAAVDASVDAALDGVDQLESATPADE